MRRPFLVAASLGALSSPIVAPAATPPQKLALLIGIDDYNGEGAPEVAEGQRWSKLSGCVYDTVALKAELEKRGFKVAVRTDEAATKQGILDAIQSELVGKAKKGDIVLFHYSGHGQQVTDDNGTPDEEDGWDETLVPYDNKGRFDGAGNLRDDELGAAVAKLTKITPNVVVSLDSCHSGTATRGHTPRGGEPVGKPLPLEKRPKNPKESGNWTGRGTGYVLLAAAQPNELANEATDPDSKLPMGAFTLNLLRVLRESGENLTYKELVSRVGDNLGSQKQHPQIEGDADKLVFSGQWSAPTPGFRVRPIGTDRKIVVEAGTLLGLHDGDEVGLYPAGSSALDPAKPKARATITRADVAVANAELVAADAKADLAAFKDGARALARTVTYPAARLVVAAPKTLAGREQLQLPFVDLQDDAGTAVATRGARLWDLRVVPDGSKFQLVRGDDTVVPIPVEAGKPQELSIDPAKRDTGAALRVAIESHQRRSLLRGLANRDLASNARVSLSLKRVEAALAPGNDGKEEWKITKEMESVPTDGSGTIALGRRIDFVVTNDSDKPMHVAILDLIADGGVHVLYPPEGRVSEIIPPKKTLALRTPIQMCPPVGLETFKLVATAEKVDFGGMEHKIASPAANRGAPVAGEETPLGQLFTSVMEGTRGGKALSAPSRGMAWGVDSVDVTLVDGPQGKECPE